MALAWTYLCIELEMHRNESFHIHTYVSDARASQLRRGGGAEQAERACARLRTFYILSALSVVSGGMARRWKATSGPTQTLHHAIVLESSCYKVHKIYTNEKMQYTLRILVP